MGITEFLAGYITKFIGMMGYPSIFILMVMESMFLPVPSEAVMPFAGFLIVDGKFSFFWVITISTLGSICGSLISYVIGKFGGKPFIEKFGKYFLIDHEELEFTEKFFNKRGEATIFICRFIPVVRHLISIPAGIANMNIYKFSIYTILGAGLWNTFLAVTGFYLRQNWELVIKYSKILDIAVIVILVALIGVYIYRHLHKASRMKKAAK